MTTTPDLMGLQPAVAQAIREVLAQFEPTDVKWEADGQGGARIAFGPVQLSDSYEQQDTWIGAHVPPLVPYCDIYPVFLRGDLRRKDGKALTAPLTQNHTFMSQAATQVSRRSNRRDATRETVSMKLLKVLHWVNSQ
jgi:hypothetical protein